MGWSLRNIGNNGSGLFKQNPEEAAAQNFLKEHVFAGVESFSENDKFSQKNAEKALEKYFEEFFQDIPADQIPKNFTQEEKIVFVQLLMGENYDSSTDRAKSELLNIVSDVLNDKYEDAWYVSAGKWVKDTAAPAVVSGANSIASIFPPTALLTEAAGAASSGILNLSPSLKDVPVLGKTLEATTNFRDTLRTSRNEVAVGSMKMVELAATEPKIFFGEMGQGITNATTATVGFVWDTARFLTYDVQKYAYGNLATIAYNLGADEESKREAVGLGSWLRHSEYMHKHTQFMPPIQSFNEDGSVNKFANQQRTLRYGTQAIGEIGVIVIGAVFTGGTAGVAYASARGTGALTARTVGTLSHVRNMNVITDANRILSKVDDIQDVVVTTRKALDAATDAKDITRLQQELVEAQVKLTRATEKAYQPNLGNKMHSIERSGVSTSQYAQQSMIKLENAQDALNRLVQAGASEQMIAAQATKVLKYTKDVELKLMQAERVGAQVSNFSGVLKVAPELNTAKNILHTGLNWGYQSARAVNPLSESLLAKSFNLGMATTVFGTGVYTDLKAAEDAKNKAAKLKEENSKATGTDSSSTNEQIRRIQESPSLFEILDSPSVPQTESNTEPLSSEFKGVNPSVNGDAVSLRFNNRSSENPVTQSPETPSPIIIKISPKALEMVVGDNNSLEAKPR